MVAISLSGSGEGPGGASSRGYSTKGRRRFLRHASSGSRFRRVIDYPLLSYFRFSKRYFKTRWPVMGVNVQMPTRSETLLQKRAAE